MKHLIVAFLVAVPVVPLLAAPVDPRLATPRKAYVVAIDDLGDDRPVAACVAAHLAAQTPLTVVASREEAEIVLRVKAHLPGQSARHVLGSMGGRPSAEMVAELPDGTKLWNDGTKLGSGWSWDRARAFRTTKRPSARWRTR
jgi:hypothetical protein